MRNNLSLLCSTLIIAAGQTNNIDGFALAWCQLLRGQR